MSRQSHLLSANDKDNNELMLAAVHRSGIYLIEKNPGKAKLGDHLMKAVCPFIASNGFPYLQMRSVGLHSMLVREKEGKDGGKSCS